MSEKINKAIKFATDAHSGQKRKATQHPYILHCLEVATIAASITESEDVIVAALLHDTVEDTDTSIEDIKKNFGAFVADLVSGDTENKRENMPKADTWLIRKKETLEVLKNSDVEHKIIWVSDKLSNMRSLYLSWQKEGDDVFGLFNQKDKNMQKWYYNAVLEYTKELKDTYAYKELKRIFDIMFTEESK